MRAGEMRRPVPRPRLPRRMSGRPASPSGLGLPISGKELLPEMPPRSKARKYSAGWKISGIDELHELRRLLQQRGVATLRIGRGLPDFGMQRLDVRRFLRSSVAVAAVTIGASQLHRRRGMHRLDAVVTRETSSALGIS